MDVLECVAVEDESKWFVLWGFTAINEVETIGTSWDTNRGRDRYHVCMQEYAINKIYTSCRGRQQPWWCAGA